MFGALTLSNWCAPLLKPLLLLLSTVAFTTEKNHKHWLSGPGFYRDYSHLLEKNIPKIWIVPSVYEYMIHDNINIIQWWVIESQEIMWKLKYMQVDQGQSCVVGEVWEIWYINLVTGDYVNTGDAVGCKCWLSEFPNANMLCSHWPDLSQEVADTDTNINTNTAPDTESQDTQHSTLSIKNAESLYINDVRSDRCQGDQTSLYSRDQYKTEKNSAVSSGPTYVCPDYMWVEIKFLPVCKL